MEQKYYYNNLIANQNITAKPNIHWVADITTVELPTDASIDKKSKLHLFFCIDVYTNFVLTYVVSLNTIRSNKITKVLEDCIEKRFPMKPKTRLIIHTDRGTQFSNESYKNFAQAYEDYFEPSMSRLATPTDNAVAERFMRTFKEHKIDGKTFQESLYEKIANDPGFRQYRSLVRQYVDSLNSSSNRKTNKLAVERKDLESLTASLIMKEPQVLKIYSSHFGEDIRKPELKQYEAENSMVMQEIYESVRTGEVVDKTPFDLEKYPNMPYDTKLALQRLHQELIEIGVAIDRNAQIMASNVEKSVSKVIEPLEKTLSDHIETTEFNNESVHQKLDILLPKKKKNREILKLRDPVTYDLFPIFLVHAGMSFKYQKDLKHSQLRICYTILFHTGTRLNEIRHLTYQDIQDAIQGAQFSLIHFKTRQPYVHVLSRQALEDLKKLELDYIIVFEKYKYKYLFGKRKPVHEKSLLNLVNQDLKEISQFVGLPYNIKSHSFRINVISTLLKITTVQNVANIIGHDDIRSTMRYRRYSLSKQEIQELMEQINQLKPKE
jgi:integrase/recombinase XerD